MLLDVHLADDDEFAVCDAVTRLRPDLPVILTSLESYSGERSILQSGESGSEARAGSASLHGKQYSVVASVRLDRA
jgi:hypothetical protein